MSINRRIPDPIHGYLSIPDWLIEIENLPPVRRMLNIRQLGLKSVINFPGAIHTRYGHSLGAMHLAGLLADRLSKKMHDKGRSTIAKNLQNNKNNLMAAGLLHDIAHGPYSHAVDFVLKHITNTTHEELANKVINNGLHTHLINHGIVPEAVVSIINGTHDFKFISGIIDGPIDVDKLDYLLRDAHHVGLKYGFDLEYFIDSYTVLGNDSELNKCLLGLDNTPIAQVTSEIFVLIWKSMYDLVYHVRESRIAEKMLEKSTLLGVENDDNLSKYFRDEDELLALDDDKLLSLLKKSSSEYTTKLVKNIWSRKLFCDAATIQLYKNSDINQSFIKNIIAGSSNGIDKISNELSIKLSEKLHLNKYQIICDIIGTKTPADIFIENTEQESGDPEELKDKSDIIKSMKSRHTMRIYIDPELDDFDSNTLKNEAISLVNEEGA